MNNVVCSYSYLFVKELYQIIIMYNILVHARDMCNYMQTSGNVSITVLFRPQTYDIIADFTKNANKHAKQKAALSVTAFT